MCEVYKFFSNRRKNWSTVDRSIIRPDRQMFFDQNPQQLDLIREGLHLLEVDNAFYVNLCMFGRSKSAQGDMLKRSGLLDSVDVEIVEIVDWDAYPQWYDVAHQTLNQPVDRRKGVDNLAVWRFKFTVPRGTRDPGVQERGVEKLIELTRPVKGARS